MTPSRDTEDPLQPDDPDGLFHPNHGQSTLLGPEQIHFPLSEEREDEDHVREVLSWKGLPWWKRPSPYLLIFGTLFGSIGFSATLAPKVAMYTALACRVHRPEYDHSYPFSLTHNLMVINATDVPIPYISDDSETAVNTVLTLLPDSAYTPLSGYFQNGLDSQQKCASDPVVQVVVARLNAVFTTSMGVFSTLTTGWWGSLSDRYGRRIVLFASLFGLFVNGFIILVTALFVDVLPGGYWFPLVGFVIEGLCGGKATGEAINHAYLADSTDPSARSRYFSLSFGAVFVGMAVGPVLGGLLIRSTGTTLSVFYFASTLQGVSIAFVLIILPESLTRARTRGAHLRRKQEKANQASNGRTLGVLKSVAMFFSPLVVLLPAQSWDADPLKRRRKDWNLFFIAIAYGLVTGVMCSFPYKYQYAAAQFNWTAETTSYYVSFTGAVRAFFLVVVLPLIIKYLRPASVQLPFTPDEPLRGVIGLSPSRGATSIPGSDQTNASEQRPLACSSTFDLALTRISAGLEIAAFLSMAIASTGTFFTLASTIDSFSTGFSPTIQALALDIYTNRRFQNQGEVGKLFGAFSIIQSLGSQIISPAFYGFVYYNTVAVFPQAIMIVSMFASSLAFVFLLFVRTPSKPVGDHITPGHGNEGAQGTETPEILVATEDEVVEG